VIAIYKWRAEAAGVNTIAQDLLTRQRPHRSRAIDDLTAGRNSRVIRRLRAWWWCRLGNGSARFDSAYWLPATDPSPPLVIEAEHIDDVIAIYKWRPEAACVLTVTENFSI
jgi:hypothetical protein